MARSRTHVVCLRYQFKDFPFEIQQTRKYQNTSAGIKVDRGARSPGRPVHPSSTVTPLLLFLQSKHLLNLATSRLRRYMLSCDSAPLLFITPTNLQLTTLPTSFLIIYDKLLSLRY